MNSFGRDVREWLTGVPMPDWAIKAGIEHYERHRKATREHVEECVTFTKGIAFNISRQDVEDVGRLPPSIELDSRRLADGLRPEVEALRKALFGSEQPPFKDLKEAARWIERTTKAYQGRAECREWFAYAVFGKQEVERAPAFMGSPLERLAQVSARLAKDTSLRQAAVIAFALAGIPPILPPARISIHRRPGGAFSHTWATIELHAGDLTFTQVRKLYNKVRQRMGTTHKKALAYRDVELLEFVRRVGDPPIKRPGNRGTIKAYWQKFEKEWNQARRKGRLTWRAGQNRYERLKVKIIR